MNVVDAVQRDLDQIKRRDPRLAESALAASALALAADLDNPRTTANARAQAAKVLLETLDRLRMLVPPAEQEDAVDDLSAKRAARRAAS